MKVLFDHDMPFWLAHGGFQTQIRQSRAGLEENGIQVEYARWWDDQQAGDVIHYFGRPSPDYVKLAHEKGKRVVVAELLTGTASRSTIQLQAQRNFIRLAKIAIPKSFINKLAWETYQIADAFICLNPFEGELMCKLFGADPRKVHLVYNGVEQEFLRSAESTRGKWLVCTATITPRKRIVELTRAAMIAKSPLWVIGKPYGKDDPYAEEFLKCAQNAPELIRYEGAIADRARLAAVYREARGFVLLSDRETLSLSALEASACGCPLLLTDLPWARTVFGEAIRYVPANAPPSKIAPSLRRFYDDCPKLKPPLKPSSWKEIGAELKKVYEAVLR